MSRKGITKEIITDVSIRLIEEKGLASFSLRAVASALRIQVSSLYNHITGQNDLLNAVGCRAVHMMTSREEQAIAGKTTDEALFALADAYRAFAGEHPELYRIIMGVHVLHLSVMETEIQKIVAPILTVLAEYDIPEVRQMHYQRILRSVMHGFFAHENTGGFSLSEIDREESYHLAIRCVANALHAEKEKYPEAGSSKQ